MYLTEKGLAYLAGEEYHDAPGETPARVEYCLYGSTYGTYTFRCADSPEHMLELCGRTPDGYSRVVRTVGQPNHTHNSRKECIPHTVLYRSGQARRVLAMLNRAILAGHHVVHI